MSEYNPCPKCGYDSSAYLTAIESRNELLEALKALLAGIIFETNRQHYDAIIKKAEDLKEKTK